LPEQLAGVGYHRRMRIVVIAVIAGVPLVARAAPPDIAVDAVGDTAARALAGADPKAPIGAVISVASLPALDDGAADRVRAQLAAQHLTIVDDAATRDGRAIVVEAANKARVLIVLGQGRGSISMIARPSAIALKGPCVQVPVVRHAVTLNAGGVDDGGEYATHETVWDLRTDLDLDVDGDGMLDWLVPVAPSAASCPEDVRWRVYVRRGSCGHELGEVGPGLVEGGASDASGFRTLQATAQASVLGADHVPVTTTTTRRFAVRAGRYAQTGQDASTGHCHHCSTWTCTPRPLP
jgi:hypothetical protein